MPAAARAGPVAGAQTLEPLFAAFRGVLTRSCTSKGHSDGCPKRRLNPLGHSCCASSGRRSLLSPECLGKGRWVHGLPSALCPGCDPGLLHPGPESEARGTRGLREGEQGEGRSLRVRPKWANGSAGVLRMGKAGRRPQTSPGEMISKEFTKYGGVHWAAGSRRSAPELPQFRGRTRAAGKPAHAHRLRRRRLRFFARCRGGPERGSPHLPVSP